MSAEPLHQPVLLKESIQALKITAGQAYLDLTVGYAGHAVEILKQGGHLYGLDVDPDALKFAKKRLDKTRSTASFHLQKRNFSQLTQACQQWKITSVAGILMDLGLSSPQLADQARGFSFQTAAPLDMRADPDLQVTAADLINALSVKELTKLFEKYGEESWALAIAKAIVKTRQSQPIQTTLDLAKTVSQIKHRQGKTHPATQVFQALRIAVNDELNSLKAVLPQAVDLLQPSGRLVIISFHSLEDRIVKKFINADPHLNNLTPKPITPTQEEINTNPRSRSAKLRVAEKK